VELKPFNVASISLWTGIVGTENFHQLADANFESADNNVDVTAIADKFNWETPLFVGRVIAALCNDSNLMQRNGKVQIVAELANYYGVVDEYGHCPASLRSLRFLLPQGLPILKSRAKLIPSLRVPWWLILLAILKSPKI
ncbi:MAG: short-chain dehydrogenase, partial [Pseudanabaena sp.]